LKKSFCAQFLELTRFGGHPQNGVSHGQKKKTERQQRQRFTDKFKPGAVSMVINGGRKVVDVAVDQGGCVETMKVTTHEAPTFEIDGIVHYGVANMSGAVPHATFPYLRTLVNEGFATAVKNSKPLALGVNTHQGMVTYEAVAQAHNLPFTQLSTLL
jgi:alanine dehydrogenase